MHHRRLFLDGGKTLRRGGIDFAWNVHVVEIRTAGQELAGVTFYREAQRRGGE